MKRYLLNLRFIFSHLIVMLGAAVIGVSSIVVAEYIWDSFSNSPIPFKIAIQAHRRNGENWMLLTSGTDSQSMEIRRCLRNIHLSDTTQKYNIMLSKINNCIVIDDIKDIVNMSSTSDSIPINNLSLIDEPHEQHNFRFDLHSNAIVLILNSCYVTDASFTCSEKFECDGLFNRMQIISFANADITDIVIPKIMLMLQNCKETLRIINLRNTKITEAGLNLIRREFPDVKLNPECDSAPICVFEAALDGTCVDFSSMGIVTDDIVRQLDSMPVTHLKLKGLPVTNKIFSILSTMTNLVEIDLQNTSIENDVDVELLAALPALHKLNLNGTKVSAESIKKLSTSKSLVHLQIGTMKNESIVAQTSTSQQTMVNPSSILDKDHDFGDSEILIGMDNHSLRKLEIDGLPITDTTLNNLARLKNLRFLSISNSPQFVDSDLFFLQHCRSLKRLVMTNTGVTNYGLINFYRLRPDVAFQSGPAPNNK
jgi:hypothetical protein